MSIQYDVPEPGDVSLMDEYDHSRTLLIPAGTSQATRDAAIADFFAASVPPAVTRADVIAAFAGLTGYSAEVLTAFFVGDL